MYGHVFYDNADADADEDGVAEMQMELTITSHRCRWGQWWPPICWSMFGLYAMLFLSIAKSDCNKSDLAQSLI